MRGKKLNRDQKFLAAVAACAGIGAIVSTAFHSCNPKHEDIKNVPIATSSSSNNGVAEVYTFVQDYVVKRSNMIRQNLTTHKDDRLTIYVNVRISHDGSVSYKGSQIQCQGNGCTHNRETGFEDIQNEVSKLNVGMQKEEREISIPVYID